MSWVFSLFLSFPAHLCERRFFFYLCLAIVTVDQSQTMASTRIPLYQVRGTHYECAHAIGVLTRQAIRHRIADDLVCLSPLFTFSQTEVGLELHRGFIETVRARYPWYWDEICALADGSEVALEQILVLNFLNETQTAFHLLEEKTKLSTGDGPSINETGEKGCTTVLLNRQDTGTFSLLHNEDHATALYMTGYLIEADIQSSDYDDGQRASPNEKFIAYCYAGAIPGKFNTNCERPRRWEDLAREWLRR